jgi:hypothetical protein
MVYSLLLLEPASHRTLSEERRVNLVTNDTNMLVMVDYHNDRFLPSRPSSPTSLNLIVGHYYHG